MAREAMNYVYTLQPQVTHCPVVSNQPLNIQGEKLAASASSVPHPTPIQS